MNYPAAEQRGIRMASGLFDSQQAAGNPTQKSWQSAFGKGEFLFKLGFKGGIVLFRHPGVTGRLQATRAQSFLLGLNLIRPYHK